MKIPLAYDLMTTEAILDEAIALLESRSNFKKRSNGLFFGNYWLAIGGTDPPVHSRTVLQISRFGRCLYHHKRGKNLSLARKHRERLIGAMRELRRYG